ncbi:hypothetical protein PPGU19_092750 (plasmid) [Paraburkholderia sp. PGU19]|nr:hypothetical protein PPGU19_092750 [Paraburkholderia sp. PGU19]
MTRLHAFATQPGLETRNVLMPIEDPVSTIAARIQMPALSKQKQRPTKQALTESTSPYTIKNLDAAIAHLERAVRFDCTTPVFGLCYWHARVRQACCTHGITPLQLRRLQRLLTILTAS